MAASYVAGFQHCARPSPMLQRHQLRNPKNENNGGRLCAHAEVLRILAEFADCTTAVRKVRWQGN